MTTKRQAIIAFTTTLPYRPPHLVRQHTHRDHEFFFCAGGSGWQHADQRRIPMRQGELYIFPVGQRHMGNGSVESECHAHVVNIANSAVEQLGSGEAECRAIIDLLVDVLPGQNFHIPLTARESDEVGCCFAELIKESEQPSIATHAMRKALTMQLLATIVRSQNLRERFAQVSSSSADNRIRGICEFLQRRYRDQHRISNLASRAGLGRSQFQARFKNFTGESVTGYLNRIRLDAAAELLRSGDLAVTTVALDCGFNSLSHFYERFGQRFDCAPQKFRTQAMT